MDPWQIAVSLGSGVIGATATQVYTSIRARRQDHQEGRVTALFLALMLENYAARCAHKRDAMNMWLSSFNEGDGEAHVPELPPFPDKTNWRALGMKHTEALLAFRVKTEASQAAIASTNRFVGFDVAWAEAHEQALFLGTAAGEHAVELRQVFRLSGAPPSAEHTSVYLKSEMERHLADKAKEQARRKENQAGHGFVAPEST